MYLARGVFNTSCLSVQAQYFRQWPKNYNDVKIENISFSESAVSCSSALKLGGNMSAIMTNISFMENNSQFVIHSVTDTLTMKGHFNFYNNKGSTFISESSKLVFSQATVKFINNTIEGKACTS